jgi:hypothetical protein
MVIADTTDVPPTSLAGSVAADLGLLTAPSAGRFRANVASGLVGRDTVIGTVTGGGGRSTAVTVPVAAEVCGLVVFEGQMVHRGQALAWVRRLDG